MSHLGPSVEAAVDLVGDVQEMTRSGGYILFPQGLCALVPGLI